MPLPIIQIEKNLWSVSGYVLICTVSWGMQYVLFTFFLVWLDPRLAHSKAPHGCTPAVLANHLTSFVNTALCALGAAYVFNLMGQDSTPLDAPSLITGPVYPWSRFLYVNFAAYCIYDMIWCFAVTRPVQHLMVAHHILFLCVSLLLLFEDFLLVVGPALLLQELSSPFVNLFHTMNDFKVKGAIFTLNAAMMSVSFLIFRVILIGCAMGLILYHWSSLEPTLGLCRTFVIVTLFAGYGMQLFWFSKIAAGFIKFFQKGDAQSENAIES